MVSAGSMFCSNVFDKLLKQVDSFQMGAYCFRNLSKYVSRVYFVSVDFPCWRRLSVVPGLMIPGGPLMTWVQPEESVTCWILRWGGGFLRRVIMSGLFSII